MKFVASLFGGLFVVDQALACNSCGQGFSFTPKMLLISSGFFLLPLSIVGFIVWRLWRDEKRLQDPSSKLDAPRETR